MDVREKVVAALIQAFEPAYVRVEDDDGISGFVVSRKFEGLTALDRQERIDEAQTVAPRLTKEERRRVLMIAGLTPSSTMPLARAFVSSRSKREQVGPLRSLSKAGHLMRNTFAVP